MNRRRVLLYMLGLMSVALLTMGCNTAPTSTPIPPTVTPIEPSEDQSVLVAAQCVVHLSGYRGIIVAPGVLKPTEGTVVSLECNGKKVEVSNKAIVDGYIETKEFGKIGIRFGSRVATVGAGEFMSLGEGYSLPVQAIEIYVQKSKQKDFMALISK